MINLKLIGATAGGSLLLGTLGGGYMMHKIIWGKVQADKVKALEADISATQGLLTESRELATSASKRADGEAKARHDAETRLSQAYRDNASLAASRASTNTRVIQEGQDIGQDLKDDYPCIYREWPSRLSNYAFNLDGGESLSGSVPGSYPASFESPIP